MIQVDAETAVALARDTVRVRPRLRWALQGGLLDLSDRVIDGTWPRVRHEIGAYLSGEQYPSVVFELQNADSLLTPGMVSGGVLANREPQDYFLDTITYDVGIERADGTYEHVPVFTGLVNDLRLEPGRVTLTAAPYFTYAMQSELPYEFVLSNTSFLGVYTSGLQTSILAAGIHPSFASATELLRSLDWNLYGAIKRGTRVGQAALLVAKSCLGTWWTTEDGQLAFASEFPGIAGDYGYWPSYWPDPIRQSDGSDWILSQPLDLAAREVVIQYQGVSLAWRSTAHEGNIGRITRTVTAPYMAFGRQAMLASRILFEQYGNYPYVLSFTTGIRGLPIQLHDRVPIVDPFLASNDGTIRTWRITSKDVAGPEMIRFEAVLEGHEDTVVTNRTFAKWDTTTWATAGAEFL